MSLPYYKVYHDTANGRLPFTYFVFGPYDNGTHWDVEVYRDHIAEEHRDAEGYVGTVSDLTRSTHIVADVWDWMDANV